jgi:hypothetical protein
MFMASPGFAAVGVFDFTEDIGDVGAYGVTTTIPGTGAYEILASGADIWGNADEFHYAYNEVSGNVRFELSPWFDAAPDSWTKIEAMMRVDNSAGSVHYSQMVRRENVDTSVKPLVRPDDYTSLQWRTVANGASGESGGPQNGVAPQKIAVQRIQSNGWEIVQGLTDYGSGWEAISTVLNPGLPDELLLGAAVVSHHDQALARAIITDVAYTQNPAFVGPHAGDPLPEACSDLPGLLISVAKMPNGTSFQGDRADNFAQAEYLLKNGTMDGYTGAGTWTSEPAIETGKRADPVVNLYDSGGYNAFDDDTEKSFPGIDALVINPSQPADGDDDNQFGVLVQGCIELTEGYHVLGGAFDDGIMIRIGGQEIGRTNAWNEVGRWEFEAPTTGVYDFEAIGFEEGGGAYLELYEYLPDGSMILIGAEGGSPVYVPEPATIALLGFGGLSLLRIRRKR